MRKLFTFLVIAALAMLSAAGVHSPSVIYAQQSPSTLVGGIFATNYLAPTSGQMAAVGGVVTNPSSNFVIQIASGVVFCNGEFQSIGQLQLTLLANTSYIVVYSCAVPAAYARTGVVGPGSVTGQPGVPNTVLVPNTTEIGIATVVCNGTACGNGGNGSITDIRNPSQWGIGDPTGAHLVASSTSGDTAGTVTLAGGTFTKTFAIPYQVAPICVATDQTAANAVKTAPTTTNVVFTGTTTDVIQYACIGNPN